MRPTSLRMAAGSAAGVEADIAPLSEEAAGAEVVASAVTAGVAEVSVPDAAGVVVEVAGASVLAAGVVVVAAGAAEASVAAASEAGAGRNSVSMK